MKAMMKMYRTRSSGDWRATGQTPDTPQEPSQEPTDDVMLFTDVQGHWAKDYIDFIADKGVIKGKAPGIFAPDDNVTEGRIHCNARKTSWPRD